LFGFRYKIEFFQCTLFYKNNFIRTRCSDFGFETIYSLYFLDLSRGQILQFLIKEKSVNVVLIIKAANYKIMAQLNVSMAGIGTLVLFKK